MKNMRFILVAIFIILTAFGVSIAEPVSLHGFTPASIDSIPLFPPGRKPMQMSENVFVQVVVKIDKKGKVKSVKTENKENLKYLKYVESYIKGLKFRPAIRKGKNQNSYLPIDILFNKRIYSPVFSFPVIADTLVLHSVLFAETFSLNKIQLPKVLTFPSYFSDIDIMETSNRYPFVIEKLSYEKGQLSNIENYMSTCDAFKGQIESAILSADIVPPKYKKKEISGDLYLMVSFFSQLSYPTLVFDAQNFDSSNILSQKRVRIINLATKYLSEPLPKRAKSDAYPNGVMSRIRFDPLNVYVRIDTLGETTVFRVGSSNKRLVRFTKEVCSGLKFYPALNQKNELVEFFGFIRFERKDVADIRISYNWLE